jgi:hypothetical protein
MSRKKPRRGGTGETGGTLTPPAKGTPGLPDPGAIVSETVLVSPKGRRYRILRTDEKDAYDPPENPQGKRS